MEAIPYLRVGTAYYKLVQAPTIAGHFNEMLAPWNIETIRQDHGKDFLSKVPKYDGFTCIPSHTDYQKEFYNFYNIYSPLKNVPKEGSITKTLSFIKHIFGNQEELGLDYFQLLYNRPIHILPILCLVSKERSTGKTTFLKWLKFMYESNLTYLTNDNFASHFNSDWAHKLLICIDEVFFNKEELTERIKYLSTTDWNKAESKGKNKKDAEFFGKFILCSNNEDSFIKIDANETRFWVLKIPPLENEETDFLDHLRSEIPAFLYYLTHRQMSCPKITRMWFSEQQIRTKALRRLVQHNKNPVEKELAIILISAMEQFDCNEIHLCPIDAVQLLSKTRIKTDMTHVRRLLKEGWRLKNKDNSLSYKKLVIWQDASMQQLDAKGRYFTVDKSFLLKNFDELMN